MIKVLESGTGWLAVNKPDGLSVHNAQTNEQDLLKLARELLLGDSQLARSVQLQPNFQMHPVHRLDAPTSGVCLLAVSPSTASQLAQAFAENKVQKTYHAVVKGVPSAGAWSWELTSRAEGRRNPQGHGRKQKALTVVRVLEQNRYFSLLELNPQTGRQHQLRRHAALARHPIIGDDRYGDPTYQKKIASLYDFRRLALHATCLKIPFQGRHLLLEAPLPSSFQELIAPASESKI